MMDPPPCGLCGQGPSTDRYCMQCEAVLCNACLTLKSKVSRWKQHVVVKWENNDEICQTHVAKYHSYCSRCDRAACNTCVSVEHNGHPDKVWTMTSEGKERSKILKRLSQETEELIASLTDTGDQKEQSQLSDWLDMYTGGADKRTVKRIKKSIQLVLVARRCALQQARDVKTRLEQYKGRLDNIIASCKWCKIVTEYLAYHGEYDHLRSDTTLQEVAAARRHVDMQMQVSETVLRAMHEMGTGSRKSESPAESEDEDAGKAEEAEPGDECTLSCPICCPRALLAQLLRDIEKFQECIEKFPYLLGIEEEASRGRKRQRVETDT